MSIVKRVRINQYDKSDTGILLTEAFKLVEDFELKEELINQFDIDLSKDIFLNIKGAKTLVDSILNLEKKVKKFDIDTDIKNIHISKFSEKNQIQVEVFNISDSDILQNLKNIKSDRISAISAYSVRNDLLDGFYKADKFFSNLNKMEFNDLIQLNIEKLEELNKNSSEKRKLRYVESEDEKLYLRAITSTNVYKDYNIAFSVFVTLYQLNILKKHGHIFEVEYFSFDESEISVIFREVNNEKNINDEVFLSFAIELTNSEIKNKAVKLNGNFIIQTKDYSVYTKNDIKTTILSISHGNTIKKANKYIKNLPENINEYIHGSIDNYMNIGQIKNFNDIQSYLSKRLERSNTPEIKKYNSEFQRTLKGQIKSLVELLEKISKLENLIKDEDIKVVEFLREKIYQSIVSKGNNTEI
ncbi:hypothetical protein LNJ05_07030 [Tenacibaculum finnmarkense genomovar ulcerans]|uniref:hypothetical protein n=1 Tax=Tenacibaculum finnmarkense TaxID=2781243 RepID=UPI00187B2DAF|nr:hypothetical protein [Tenacibaculum finnmarkense]MBE7645754.1 hypothetical protein [Tenacibaculum finnmarkense genomovar ulcerans]MBE7688098.1 hypothetical protein [Tenacibaculum finnmarkense genomovar ulcerans]MCD8432516.1 hypothetical protein [Tenacibaculum finnmarkense genomovar ulcerans]MCG8236434.1 hypothetical protein [Tenacibaculum finnmarkense genomovar ulcerans]MCG8733740.1 hypothetical protein [Tenacibaculum finnmarkense]